MLGLLTTILGGGWVVDFARLKLAQPSLAGAGAELGNTIFCEVFVLYIVQYCCQAQPKLQISLAEAIAQVQQKLYFLSFITLK